MRYHHWLETTTQIEKDYHTLRCHLHCSFPNLFLDAILAHLEISAALFTWNAPSPALCFSKFYLATQAQCKPWNTSPGSSFWSHWSSKPRHTPKQRQQSKGVTNEGFNQTNLGLDAKSTLYWVHRFVKVNSQDRLLEGSAPSSRSRFRWSPILDTLSTWGWSCLCNSIQPSCSRLILKTSSE